MSAPETFIEELFDPDGFRPKDEGKGKGKGKHREGYNPHARFERELRRSAIDENSGIRWHMGSVASKEYIEKDIEKRLPADLEPDKLDVGGEHQLSPADDKAEGSAGYPDATPSK